MFYLTVSPGSSCKDDDIVCVGGSFCNPDNKVCSCPDGSTDEGGKCVVFKIETGTVQTSTILLRFTV